MPSPLISSHTNENLTLAVLKKRIKREQAARKSAEALLEAKSLELFQTNQKLALSQERFILAAQGSNDGIWDWNILTTEMYFSDNWCNIIGYKTAEFVPTLKNWMNHIHVQDRTKIKAVFDSFQLNPQVPLVCEYRMRHLQGHYVWVLTKGNGILDSQGTVIRMAGSQTDISDQKKIQEQLIKGAHYDKLTGLYNRLIFIETLNRQIESNINQDFAVLFIDLDGFKHINDSLGHKKGDELLKTVAKRLKDSLREGDTLARWGGG